MTQFVEPTVAGIDPGLKGGIAIQKLDGAFRSADDIPIIEHTKKKKLVNANNVAATLRENNVTYVVIEDVSTRPGQGIASSGTFMKAVGTLYGVAAACGCVVIWVTPQQWKKYYGLVGPNKEASRAKAVELFPELAPFLKFKKNADRAEAGLLTCFSVALCGSTASIKLFSIARFGATIWAQSGLSI